MNSETQTYRIAKWDNAKLLLIYLVVLGHIFDYYTKQESAARGVFLFIYTFHMPLFMFISGMFSHHTVEQRRWRDIWGYLILYLVMKFITLMAEIILFRDTTFSFFSTHWIPWYAFVMFLYLMLMIPLSRISRPFVFIMSIMLAVVAGYDNKIGVYLSLSKTIVFFPFFFTGWCVDGRKLLEVTEHILVKILSAAGLVLWWMICMVKEETLYPFRNMLTSRYPYKALGDWALYGGQLRLQYYVIAFAISFMVLCIVPHRKIGRLTAVGSRTLQIYALHTVPLFLFVQYWRVGDLVQIVTPIFYMFTFPVIAVVIVWICSFRFWGKGLRWLMYPKVIAEEKPVEGKKEIETE